MEKNNITEEVTITPVIRDIERLFNRVISLVGLILKMFYEGMSRSFLFLLKNIYWLSLAIVLGGLVGYYSMLYVPQTYSSHLVLRPSINAKEQLYADVDFFNSLIEKEEIGMLSKILHISNEDAESLSEVIIETKTSYLDKIERISGMYQGLDSVTAKFINFKDLLEEGDFPFSRDFTITVSATNQFVFSKIEPAIIKYLERVPELQELRREEKRILENKKAIYLKEMTDLDSLKTVLNDVMLEQAKSSGEASKNTSISLGKSNSESSINPLDVYTKKIRYVEQIIKIDEKINDYNNCYQVFTHFSEYGYKTGFGRLARTIIVSIVFFIFTCVVLLFRRLTKKVG